MRRLPGWACGTRTRKCRFKKCYLKCRTNSLGFRNILVPETFRGGAAKRLTRGSGAKTGQFEIVARREPTTARRELGSV